MTKGRFIILLILILFIFSCKNHKPEKTLLAQVHDTYLYLEDLNEDTFPNDATEEDSITIINNKIDIWIRKQSMLNRAIINLSEEQKDIESIVEDYKATLLIEKYKQEYLKQEIDTNVTNIEIENYYKNYSGSFKVGEALIKVKFYKFKSDDKNLSLFRQYFFSDNEEDISKKEILAKESAVKYDDFGGNWIEFSAVSNLLPKSINNAETILKQSKRIQTRDNDNSYFLYFEDYKLKGETIPLELARDRIKLILINNRKTNIINDLENKIYQNDVKNGNIKIFVE